MGRRLTYADLIADNGKSNLARPTAEDDLAMIEVLKAGDKKPEVDPLPDDEIPY